MAVAWVVAREGGGHSFELRLISYLRHNSINYTVENIIEIRFEGDNSLDDDQKLRYTRYINRIFVGQKEDIVTSHGYVKIISKKGLAGNITFVSDNSKLNKLIDIKLFNSPILF